MKIIITPKAQKQYNHLQKSEQIKIKKKTSTIGERPLEGKKLSGELEETRAIRAWPYRIIYYIDKKSQKIFIVTIAHRQGVYK